LAFNREGGHRGSRRAVWPRRPVERRRRRRNRRRPLSRQDLRASHNHPPRSLPLRMGQRAPQKIGTLPAPPSPRVDNRGAGNPFDVGRIPW
jgi:hypothetical protein